MNCQSESCKVIFLAVFPAVGAILANVVYLSPFLQVYRIHQRKPSQMLNPIPYAFQYLNNSVWLLYAYVIKDWYVAAANVFGLMLALYYLLVLYGQQAHVAVGDGPIGQPLLDSPRRQKEMALNITLFGAFMVALVGCIVFISIGDRKVQQQILGIVTIVILISFYGAPLSVLVQVVKQRDASAIYLPLAATCLLNAAFWTVYGIFVSDLFIWAPNALGVLLSLVQIGLVFTYHRRKVIVTQEIQQDEIVEIV